MMLRSIAWVLTAWGALCSVYGWVQNVSLLCQLTVGSGLVGMVFFRSTKFIDAFAITCFVPIFSIINAFQKDSFMY